MEIQIQLLFLLIFLLEFFNVPLKKDSNTTIVSINLELKQKVKEMSKFKYNYCFY